MYAAFHAGDAERALSYFAPDAVIDARVRVDGGVRHGRDGVAAVVGQWTESFDDWREEIEEIRDRDGVIEVVSVQTGTARQSGVEVHTRYVVLYEVRDGEIVKMTLRQAPETGSAAEG